MACLQIIAKELPDDLCWTLVGTLPAMTQIASWCSYSGDAVLHMLVREALDAATDADASHSVPSAEEAVRVSKAPKWVRLLSLIQAFVEERPTAVLDR